MPTPPILKRLISQLKQKGYDDEAAHAIAVSALQKSGNLHPGTETATKKGERRGKMTPEQRAKDRAAKRLGRKPDDFTYDKRTNTAKVKPIRRKRKKAN